MVYFSLHIFSRYHGVPAMTEKNIIGAILHFSHMFCSTSEITSIDQWCFDLQNIIIHNGWRARILFFIASQFLFKDHSTHEWSLRNPGGLTCGYIVFPVNETLPLLYFSRHALAKHSKLHLFLFARCGWKVILHNWRNVPWCPPGDLLDLKSWCWLAVAFRNWPQKILGYFVTSVGW